MVVFTCNHCGESLKKNNVEKHKFGCNRNVSVSCMDCFKDFNEADYNSHTQCITEAERYSGKDYVPKANQNKGQKKQEAWVDLVRSITETKKTIPIGVKKILEAVSNYENIPRKKGKFLNFMKNSFRYMKVDELESAWDLLEEAMKDSKSAGNAENHQNGNGTEERKDEVKENGSQNGHKRKLEEDSEEPKSKKKLKKDPEIEAEATPEITENTAEEAEKFKWSELIREYLSSKTSKKKDVKLTKLKGKIVKKYKTFTGREWSDKIESKFNKKMNKIKGLVIDNERVRLIQ